MYCPKDGAINSTSVQLLTQGFGFDKKYWDFAPGYSNIDAAAAAGYTVFSYDRLGVGASNNTTADPIQTIQAPLQVVIASTLANSLRAGAFSSTPFKHIMGIGHSFGSITTAGMAAAAPIALDAIVLTGFTLSNTSQAAFTAAPDPQIARLNQPDCRAFRHLSNAYVVAWDIRGVQFDFFRSPNFPPANLPAANTPKQTMTFGELLNTTDVLAPEAKFTGLVAVINGENDFPFCQRDCSVVLAKASPMLLFPRAKKAGTLSFVLKGAGHAVNLHLGAETAFEKILGFVRANVF